MFCPFKLKRLGCHAHFIGNCIVHKADLGPLEFGGKSLLIFPILIVVIKCLIVDSAITLTIDLWFVRFGLLFVKQTRLGSTKHSL